MLKRYFLRVDDLIYKIEEKKWKLEELKHNLYKIGGISYDDMPNNTAIRSADALMIAQIEAIDELTKEIAQLVKKLAMIKKEYNKDIEKLEDPRHKVIIRGVFMEHRKISEIARIMSVSERNVYTLKKEAIERFKEILQTA